MLKFRERPVVVEAFHMTEARSNDNSEWPSWLHAAWQSDGGKGCMWIDKDAPKRAFVLGTREGVHRITWDDWIIRGIEGELYACKPDIFEATYEPVLVASAFPPGEIGRLD
ncbi:hypothetical protein LCGC14_2363530 [marine sediment metagenome]|uniref:Uncharacterized protein n=1 Tax=marine sediment metagenome TaxID=412755 RepID=A0A0F9C619_9ZZZZ